MDADGRCRYEVAGQPTESVSMDLLGTTDATSWAARTAGTQPFDANGRRIALDVPGAGIVVRRGNAAALVRLTSTSQGQSDAGLGVEALGKAIRSELPDTALGSLAPGERDPCGVVPPGDLDEKGATAGDPAAAGECAYNLSDATRLQFGVHPVTAEDRTPGTKATCGPLTAQWFGTTAGSGGSGHLVAVDGKVAFTVTLSSPSRSVADQQRLAQSTCAKLHAAA